MSKTLIGSIANAVQAHANCMKSNNSYSLVWEDTLDRYTKLLPSGSGIDSGCKIDLVHSTDKKIIIETSFHHMDENGYYDGWTFHQIVLTPAFVGFDIKVTGQNRNQIKEYLTDLFCDHLLIESSHDFKL